MAGRILCWLISVLPQHGVSRLIHRLARWRWRPWKNGLIRAFTRRFDINLSEAASPERDAYTSFNAFFTRALAPGVRPIAGDAHAIVSPVDGVISEFGTISHDRLIQAKQQDYALSDLLGGDQTLAQRFVDGEFATLYLSPRDYHRIHMPIAGKLEQMLHIPGRLFGVSSPMVRHIPRLFARNERVVCVFESAAGPLAMILVGAIGVGSIETDWAGEITPPRGRRIRAWSYTHSMPLYSAGEEMGRFNLGSTVILLWGPEAVRWRAELATGEAIKMGQLLGTYTPLPDDLGIVPIEGEPLAD